MNRDSYSNPQSHASFQPRSPQFAINPTQLSQPVHHSSSTSDLGTNWLNKASSWVADKFQTAQNFIGSGDTIASDQILPALKGTVKPALSQADRTNQPLVGVIDSGFGTDEHGRKMVEAIQKENPQAKLWQGGGVGKGGGLESLVEFVDVAKATGQRAVANLSFDLSELHSDGSTSTRAQLTAEEQSALAYARDNGVLVVASSGNQGGVLSALGQASQPSDNLIVVGAANGSDRASYSSYGNGLDLVAEVDAAGTSLAAAKVTGAIANIWSANPELSRQQVNQILTATATDLKTSGWDAETGAGLLNSTGAINLAKSTTPAPTMFSGTQLMQQVSGSLGNATWVSRDGAVASERTTGFGSWLKDNAHGILDVAGFIPVVGAVADVANAGLYAAEGDYANAALSAAAAVPGIGDAAAAVKLANRGVQAAQTASRGTRPTQGTSAAAVPSRPRSGRAPTSAAHPPTPRPTSRDVSVSTGSGRETDSSSTKPQQHVSSGNPGRRDPGREIDSGSTQPQKRGSLGSPGRTGAQSNSGSPQSSSRSPQSTGQVTIRQGDTLWKIAQDRLGSGDRWRELRKPDGSPFTEQEAGHLQVGKPVQVPNTQLLNTQPSSSAPDEKTIATSDSQYTIDELWLAGHPEHTIRPGETLWEIAERTYGDGRKWTNIRKSDKTPYTSDEARQLQPGTTVYLSGIETNKTTSSQEIGSPVSSINQPSDNHPSEYELNNAKQSAQKARARLVGVSDSNKTETHAATETGQITIRGRGRQRDSRDRQLADDSEAFMYKNNIEFIAGRPKNSHAERKVFIDELKKNPDEAIIAIGVDRPICDAGGTSGGECTHFFEEAAQVTGKTIVIAEMDSKDPNAKNTWVFRPDAPPEKHSEN